MPQAPSPDLPAWICYLLVLTLSMLTARANVERLVGSYPGHWGYLSTWAIFFAHVAVPVLLLWFLDYTNALNDSSLFAALVVAFGYRQIFNGGVQGIVMPGQTPALWKPFEAWVNGVAEKIAERAKSYRDRLDEFLRSSLAEKPEPLHRLLLLALDQTSNLQTLQKALADVASAPAPAGIGQEEAAKLADSQRARILLRDLRASQPALYGIYLLKRGLITRTRYEFLFRNARARIASAALMAVTMGAFGVGLSVFLSSSGQDAYYRWRFAKANATAADRFRTRRYLVQKIEALTTGANHRTEEGFLTSLLAPLAFRDVPVRYAEDLLRLLIDQHSPVFDGKVVPKLIEVLRTENSEIRLHVHTALKDLYRVDYQNETLPSNLSDWVPKKDESAADIDTYVKFWSTSWAKVRSQPR